MIDPANSFESHELAGFRSHLVDRIRSGGDVWQLPGGQILLPNVFGFCGGVDRALAMLDEAVTTQADASGKLFLLGEIIHNPWVNEYYQQRGVRILSPTKREELQNHITSDDCAVIPAFGVPVEIERRLAGIGCRVIDTTCGNVRRLWTWAERAARDGFGILIYGRARHDETVVTKSRLEDVGGRYVVVGSLQEAEAFCGMLAANDPPPRFREVFDDQATNAETLAAFERLAQVSQTTMLYDETKSVRDLARAALTRRFGEVHIESRLRFEPTVCRATQDRQNAAVERCRHGCDLVVVVGGFGSSNTRHLFELAREYVPAYFIEDADAIRSRQEIRAFDPRANREQLVPDWLPEQRPLRIGVLAGASSPEVVVGGVLQRLAEFLS